MEDMSPGARADFRNWNEMLDVSRALNAGTCCEQNL
jgi:hypothetical protein